MTVLICTGMSFMITTRTLHNSTWVMPVDVIGWTVSGRLSSAQAEPDLSNSCYEPTHGCHLTHC